MIENPIRLVRELKGAPLSILFAMAIAGQNIGAEWLSRVTGYTDKPINQALLLLEEYGFIARINRYHWGLTAGCKQLPLMVPKLEDNGSRNYCDSQGTTATTAYSNEQVKVGKAAAESETSRNYCDSIKELHRAGIHKPTDDELARLSHVTPEYIRAHVDQAKKEHIRTGLLVHRIRCGDPSPIEVDEGGVDYISGALKMGIHIDY